MKSKRRFAAICLVLTTLLLSGCGANPTPAAPIGTSTPAATTTSLPTATSTPILLPGKLLIVRDREIFAFPADPSYGNSQQEILFPELKFTLTFNLILGEGKEPVLSPLLSPDGQKLALYSCNIAGMGCLGHRLSLIRLDLSNKVELFNYLGGLLAWSPDSEMLLMQGDKGPTEKLVISVQSDFGAIFSLPAAEAAFWSYDGEQIYFYKDGWHVVNSDGTNEQSVPCDLCELAPTPTSFAVDQSPDGKHVAIGYRDGSVFIVNPDNFMDFKVGSAGGYISRVKWSPDGEKLAVSVDTTTSQSDILILNVDGTTLDKLARPQGINITLLCGWSPDSQYIDYLTLRDKGSDIYLHEVGAKESILRMSFETIDRSCPVWLN